MVVQAACSGAAVTDTLEQITDRIESKLQETPNPDYLKSYTSAGQATIFVSLKDATPPKQVPEIWYRCARKCTTSETHCRREWPPASTTSSVTPTEPFTALPQTVSLTGS